VADLEGLATRVNKNFWRAAVSISIQTADGGLVPDAVVIGNWASGSAGISCMTGPNGMCSVTSRIIAQAESSVGFAVTSVSHATLHYDPSANADADGDSDGTSIVVARP
jgi:hypothetical protein